jgi:hypothetical protein
MIFFVVLTLIIMVRRRHRLKHELIVQQAVASMNMRVSLFAKCHACHSDKITTIRSACGATMSQRSTQLKGRLRSKMERGHTRHVFNSLPISQESRWRCSHHVARFCFELPTDPFLITYTVHYQPV